MDRSHPRSAAIRDGLRVLSEAAPQISGPRLHGISSEPGCWWEQDAHLLLPLRDPASRSPQMAKLRSGMQIPVKSWRLSSPRAPLNLSRSLGVRMARALSRRLTTE